MLPAIQGICILALLSAIHAVPADPGGAIINALNPALPLYYSTTGHPACGDIRESHTGVGTCEFDAAMCALAKINPKWLSSKIQYDGDPASLQTATFTVYDNKGVAHPSLVHCASAISGDYDNDIASAAWWPGGFEQALLQMGPFGYNDDGSPQGVSNGKLTPLAGSQALSILSGLDAVEVLVDKGSAWGYFLKADSTPIIITTGDGSALVGGHAYTVMHAFEADDPAKTHMLHLFNPWHTFEDHKVDDIWDQIVGICHLSNWDTYTG